MLLTTYQMKVTGLLTPVAFRLRVAINLMGVATYVAFTVFTRNWAENSVSIAACEWCFVTYILMFEWLDSMTVSDTVAAAAIEEDMGVQPRERVALRRRARGNQASKNDGHGELKSLLLS